MSGMSRPKNVVGHFSIAVLMVDHSDLRCPCNIARGLPCDLLSVRVALWLRLQQLYEAKRIIRSNPGCPEPSQGIISDGGLWGPLARAHIISKNARDIKLSGCKNSLYHMGVTVNIMCQNTYCINNMNLHPGVPLDASQLPASDHGHPSIAPP